MKAKEKSKRVLWIFASAIIIVTIVLGGVWFVRRRALVAAEAELGDVVTAFVGDLTSGISASGRLLPRQETEMAFSVAGQVERVYVQIGDQVKTGDMLARMHSDDLRRAVESAEQNLAIQEANLARLQRGPDEKELATARAFVADAQAYLDDLLAGPSEEELALAQAAFDSAQAKLADLLAGPSKEELAQAQAALLSARTALRVAEDRNKALANRLVVAQQDIKNAETAIGSARKVYNTLIGDDWRAADSYGPYSLEGLLVKKAGIDYDVAVATYNLTKVSINDSAYRSAQAQLARAEAAWAALTKEKTVQIAAAESQVAHAKANLTALTEEKTAQIAGARAQLAQAKANLAELLDGASQEQLTIAQARVELALISIEEAQENLANAVLVAPFDGVVTNVYVTVGEWVSYGPAVELVNTNSLQVVLDVDEVDIARIQVGQLAAITLEAWPDQELTAEVMSIAEKAKISAEIVTYEVHLTLAANNLAIRTGMTVNADLVTAHRENVLLVPNWAIITDLKADKHYVYLIQNGKSRKVEIAPGLCDHSYTEIISGLKEGDRLSIVETEPEFRIEPGVGKLETDD